MKGLKKTVEFRATVSDSIVRQSITPAGVGHGSASSSVAGCPGYAPFLAPPHPLPPLLEQGHSSPIPQGQLQTHPSAKLIPQQVVGHPPPTHTHPYGLSGLRRG